MKFVLVSSFSRPTSQAYSLFPHPLQSQAEIELNLCITYFDSGITVQVAKFIRRIQDHGFPHLIIIYVNKFDYQR